MSSLHLKTWLLLVKILGDDVHQRLNEYRQSFLVTHLWPEVFHCNWSAFYHTSYSQRFWTLGTVIRLCNSRLTCLVSFHNAPELSWNTSFMRHEGYLVSHSSCSPKFIQKILWCLVLPCYLGCHGTLHRVTCLDFGESISCNQGC